MAVSIWVMYCVIVRQILLTFPPELFVLLEKGTPQRFVHARRDSGEIPRIMIPDNRMVVGGNVFSCIGIRG